VRSYADLMRVFAGVEPVRLIDAVANPAVFIDVVHSKRAWFVVGCEEVLPLHINARVDRTRWEVLRLTVLSQRACSRINAERMGKVLVASEAGSSAARHDVDVVFRGMRPRVLNVSRQCHGVALG